MNGGKNRRMRTMRRGRGILLVETKMRTFLFHASNQKESHASQFDITRAACAAVQTSNFKLQASSLRLMAYGLRLMTQNSLPPTSERGHLRVGTFLQRGRAPRRHTHTWTRR